jgi:hypothetical protein
MNHIRRRFKDLSSHFTTVITAWGESFVVLVRQLCGKVQQPEADVDSGGW